MNGSLRMHGCPAVCRSPGAGERKKKIREEGDADYRILGLTNSQQLRKKIDVWEPEVFDPSHTIFERLT